MASKPGARDVLRPVRQSAHERHAGGHHGGRARRAPQASSRRTAPSPPRRSAASSASSTSCCRTASIPASARSSMLTQYKAHSLIQHVQRGWGYLRGEFGEFVELVPAQQQISGNFWYLGARPTRCTRTWTSSDAHAPDARAGAGRRSHLQDGLRSDDRLSPGEERRHHRGRGPGAARCRRVRIRCDDGHRVEPHHQVRRRSPPIRIRFPGKRGHGDSPQWVSMYSIRGCWRNC